MCELGRRKGMKRWVEKGWGREKEWRIERREREERTEQKVRRIKNVERNNPFREYISINSSCSYIS